MKTLYYINGKQVDINTYYSVSSSDYIRKHIWKSCISYYKTHQVSLNLLQDFLMKGLGFIFNGSLRKNR